MMAQGKVEICGVNTSKLPLLTEEEKEELLARIRAITRRPGRLEAENRLEFADVVLALEQHEVTFGQTTLSLSKKETALLEFFMRNPGRTLNREAILSYVWGSSSEVEDGNLDNYIYFLRRRFRTLNAPVKLTTVHGVGYRLEGSGHV